MVKHGHIDALFATGFLWTMGLCVWPIWFGNPLHIALLAAVCFATTGDLKWGSRLPRVTLIASIGLWGGGARSWQPWAADVATRDQAAFTLILLAAAAWALWRPLPSAATTE